MAPILSKLSREYSCYELGHPWCPSCTKAALTLLACVPNALKIYSTLYLISGLLRSDRKTYFKCKFFLETIRSSAFLTANGVSFLIMFCIVRRFFNFNILTVSFVPIVLASATSVLIEPKPRRRLLAVYMANIAVESIYRMAVSRGLVRPVPYGDVLIFSAALSIYLYLYRIQKCGKTLSSAFGFLLGSEEQSAPIGSSRRTSPITSQQQQLASLLKKLFAVRESDKGKECPHSFSCVQYVLQGTWKPFAVGVTVQYLLTALSSSKLLMKLQFRKLFATFFRWKQFSLGAFLAALAFLFRLCQCSLRRWRRCNSAWHAAISGSVAGASFCFYRSSTLALYLASKLCENLCVQAHLAGYLPSVPGSDVLLFSLATAVAFQAVIFEPHNLRPSYYNFLNSGSKGFFDRINRRLLDEFGTGASRRNPLYWPQLDPAFSALRQEDYPPLYTS